MRVKRAASNPFYLNEDVRIEGISHDGCGIARYKGKTLFVDGVLPAVVESFQTREEAHQTIFEYIEVFYNRQRKHSTNGYLSFVVYKEKLAKAA